MVTSHTVVHGIERDEWESKRHTNDTIKEYVSVRLDKLSN